MTAFFSTLSRLISTASSALRRSSKSGTVSDSSRLNFSYISSVVVSVIISSSLVIHVFQADIKDSRRMCQSADGNVVDASAGHFEHIIQRNVARRLELRSSVTNRNRLAHRRCRHVVEQNSFDAERKRL